MTDSDNTRTLIGVVSGGAGCGQGVPGLFSRVSYHIDWIKCIIEQSAQLNNHQQEVCRDTIKPEPTCVEKSELVFEVKYFQDIKSKSLKLCKEENFFASLFDKF